MDVKKRLERFLPLLESAGADVYVASSYPNTYYFTLAVDVPGFLLLPIDGSPRLIVREQSHAAAQDLAQGCEVIGVRSHESYEERVLRELQAFRPPSILVDHLSSQACVNWTQRLRGVKLGVRPDLPASFRRRKEPEEVELLRKAAEIADRGMEAAFSALRPGVKEREVALEAEYAMRKAGSQELAFNVVLNTGARSAYPDVCRADKVVAEGDMGFVDLGPRYQGYMGDMTRCFILGQPTARQRELVNTVRRVQEEALQMVRPGLRTEYYDLAIRRAFTAAGYEGNPPHHTGHSLGLGEDIPDIVPATDDVILLGDVMTVEIGAYVRDFGGARIEDMVIVADGKPEVLTRFPKDRIVI